MNEHEPKPQVGLPMCPDYLPVEARAIWDSLGSELVRNGIMTALDGAALADLVEIEMLNRQLSADLKGSTPILETDHDSKKNPLWALKLDYVRERRAQHQQFGMTPASRSKIVASPDREDDSIESAIN